MKVLVIGGGLGGLTACTGLRRKLGSKNGKDEVKIILVDPKDHIEVVWAAFRSPFDSKTGDDSLFDLAKYADKNGIEHIRSTVTNLAVDEQQVTLANGETIGFDVCVIATGAANTWEGLGRKQEAVSKTREERLAEMKTEGNKLLNANSVLVVGGGLIGSEVAGDLADHAKMLGKTIQITLVHSGTHLCHTEFTEKAGVMVQKKLEKRGVTVVLNDKVTETDGKMTLQSSGEEVKAEQVVRAVGIQPRNTFLDDKYKTETGWIDCDDCFQVKGAEGKLFAIGDCCTVLPNSGSVLGPNIGVLGHNVMVALDAKKDGQKTPPMKKYVKGPGVYVCAVGTRDGVAMTPAGHTQFMLPWVKNKTLFLFKPRGDHGLEH